MAYRVGQGTLRPYAHRFSPKRSTQPQLFAAMVLKELLRLDYRKLAALLADTPDLCALIGLTIVPHFTTFQKDSCGLLRCERAQRLLDKTIRIAVTQRRLGQRWQVETVNRMLKRLLDAALRARRHWTPCREIFL